MSIVNDKRKNGSAPNSVVVEAANLSKDLLMGQVAVHALRGVSLNVQRGEFLSIIGPSGSGKSTLLGLIGGLDSPTGGNVVIDGVDITRLSERALTHVRNEKIGFVFQFFNLVSTLTALENVALPVQFAKNRKVDPTKRAKDLLVMLDLEDRVNHRPNQLSGGEQQRVAIARALANNPPLLLCDEPTGNLDSVSGALVMSALRDVQQRLSTTVILVTHDMNVASQTDRVIALVDGRIADEIDPRSSAQLAAVQMLKSKRASSEMVVVRGS